MKPLMPPEIYAMVHDTRGTPQEINDRLEIVQKFLKSQDIWIEEKGLNARIFKGAQQVGQAFYVHLSEK
jgi:hypothetical protein